MRIYIYFLRSFGSMFSITEHFYLNISCIPRERHRGPVTLTTTTMLPVYKQWYAGICQKHTALSEVPRTQRETDRRTNRQTDRQVIIGLVSSLWVYYTFEPIVELSKAEDRVTNEDLNSGLFHCSLASVVLFTWQYDSLNL